MSWEKIIEDLEKKLRLMLAKIMIAERLTFNEAVKRQFLWTAIFTRNPLMLPDTMRNVYISTVISDIKKVRKRIEKKVRELMKEGENEKALALEEVAKELNIGKGITVNELRERIERASRLLQYLS
ncbi:MAG: hypothetical protein B6U69_01790 [Thermofilum sp. ex4484_15]|nr:MAG: hypothetical protein B6U69_01790 [Thermofilum sp. ex4484_15]